MFEIDKDIIMPESKVQTKYPFAEMEIGDSFFVPSEENPKIKHKIAASIHGSASAKKKKGFDITIRVMPGGVRCWRIK